MNSTALQPLRRRRIAITRASEQVGELADNLIALGAEPILCPAIAIAAPASYVALDAAIAQLDRYDWIIFTSANAVAAFVGRLTAPLPPGTRICAIGPATAAAAREAGMIPSFIPDTHVAEAIVAQIGDIIGQRVLLPQADIARQALAVGLRDKGAVVDEVTAYRTVPGAGAAALAVQLRDSTVDALLFTSSSTVRYLLQGLAEAGIDFATLPRRPAIVCIGPITAQTAGEHGLMVDAVAEEYTTAGLVAALVRLFDQESEEKDA